MAAETQSSDPPRKKTRGRGLRTTTGCMTCRKRHMKCDESKPICKQCQRTNKTCLYSDIQRRSTTTDIPTAKDQTPNNGIETSVATNAIDTTTTNAVPPTSNDSVPDAPLHHLDQSGVVEPQSEVEILAEPVEPQTSITSSLAQYVGDLRSPTQSQAVNFNNFTSPASSGFFDQPISVAAARWLGMLAGDAEIEVDLGGFEASSTCPNETLSRTTLDETNGYNADLSFTQTMSHSTNVEEQPSIMAQTNEESFWRSSKLTPDPQEQRLFEFFINDLSQWIDLFDPYGHFSTLVPRLALHNVGLMNAILALSIRRISLESHDADQPWPQPTREDALHYYHQALQYVASAMQYQSYHTSLELLATTVIISAYEMLDGSTRDWERHLQGVFWIQRSQVIHGDTGGLRGANWWAWLCQDVWAAFRDKRRVFTFWKPQKTLSEMTPSQLASRSIFLLAKVVNYCSQEESTCNFTSSFKTAEILTVMLDEWQSLLTPEFSPLPSGDRLTSTIFQPVWIHPPMYAVSVQVHHAARILIALKQPSLGGIAQVMQRQTALDKHVNVICGIASKLIDYASSTMSSQCLFIGKLVFVRTTSNAGTRLFECWMLAMLELVGLLSLLEKIYKSTGTLRKMLD